MHYFVTLWFDWVLQWGYLGIIVLMAMESSVIPVPAEIVIPPAAFLAAQGKLTFVGVILAGTFGSYLGAAISYWVSRWVGRPVISRFGKYFFLSQGKLERAEIWLARYEASGVFFARLLPVIRHLISIPAGIVRMNFWMFSATTIAGSAVWCSVLTYLGNQAYRAKPDLISNPEGLLEFIKERSHSLVLLVAAFAVLYLLFLRFSAKRTPAA
ncbi:MAG TPA: DedA family protein [Terriglobales bacterium]|jgi:membrane protein DedA with SNARE-associated domain